MNYDIKQYSSYFNEKIAKIDKTEPRLFRKVLLMGVIDTLSRAAYPSISGNHKRVTRFVKSCSGWPEHNRVSAQQLLLYLIDSGTKSSPLFVIASTKVASWPDGEIILPVQDLSFSEADAVAAPHEKKFVKNATYLQLFYTYRNHLAHEFREPGYGMELNQDSPTPYYHGMIGNPWQLVFTNAFMRRICTGCLNGLIQLLVTENRSPYDCYKFGSIWEWRRC
jgi:hypothetical protein